MKARLAALLAWLERLASRRLGALVLFVLGLAVYAVQALAWPLGSGRDLDEYLLAYVQLFDRHVLLPWSLLFRTPLTPLVAGGMLDVFHGALAEPATGVLFAGSVVAWSAAARTFGPRAALAVAVVLLGYPSYALMFHELSSETTFSAAFAGWALLVTRAYARPSSGRWALVGLGVAVLAYVRPGNAVLLVFVLLPLVFGGQWRDRLRWAAAFAVAATLPLVAWSVQNGLRYGDYTLARGGNAVVPFYRAFITDHIISPENGPASRKLATAMQEHLLTREPYKAYHVTLAELFTKGSFRVHEDLYLLSDQVFGWSSNYQILRETGIEGVRAHPGTYASGVADTIWTELDGPYFRTAGAAKRETEKQKQARTGTVVIGGQRLPKPTEGQPIPGGQVVWISRPDQSIRQVWTSPTTYYFAFEHPADRARFDAIERKVGELFGNLPSRAGNAQLALRLDQLSRWYPRPWLWILVGVLAIAFRRPRGIGVLVSLALAAFLVVLLNALGLFADPHFIAPVAPAFVLFGLGALLGRKPDPGVG